MTGKPKRLYDFPFSGNGYKVRLALAQLGIPVEYEIVDLIARATKSPEFLAKNSLGEIPVLELDDGTLLRESNAILFWLAEGTFLMPPDRLGRSRMLQWMFFEQNHIDKVIGRSRFLRRYPQFRATSQAAFDHWHEIGGKALKLLDGELSQHPFMVGETYSAADICIFGYVHCAEEAALELSQYPAVAAWIGRVKSQPGYIPIEAKP